MEATLLVSMTCSLIQGSGVTVSESWRGSQVLLTDSPWFFLIKTFYLLEWKRVYYSFIYILLPYKYDNVYSLSSENCYNQGIQDSENKFVDYT